MMKKLLLGFLVIGGLMAQTIVAPPITTSPCPVGTNAPYSEFGFVSLSYDYFAATPAAETGFGVKTGTCSKAFLVTVVSTGIGPNAQNNGYASLTEHFEYHIANSGYFEFIGDGQVGAVLSTTSGGTVTNAMFGGGAAISYDVVGQISKGKFHLPVVLHADYVAITANQVKPTYTLEFRKTF